MSRTEPISPELVLVSPELAARARDALPERPWEAFAPPRPAPTPRRVVIRTGARSLQTVPAVRRMRAAPPRQGATRVVLGYLVLLALAFSALTWAAEQTPAPTLGVGDAAPGPAPVPLPEIGYGFPGGLLQLTGDEGGRAVVTFSGGCAAGVATPSMPLSKGAFRFEGSLPGTRVHADVRGRVLDERRVSLHVELLGPGCPELPIDAIASISA